ncbi:MAG: ADP-dependent NAD(P)H-hydrate dehydratase / NAD(P)H-hydrate epimerase [Pseudonocardiales bacterium]|nr:ADP-dependent NAD(P)H-hydrate dehydratase / NAD(P)H-hydrate epimerase [Pseudonocardiales bacterium]
MSGNPGDSSHHYSQSAWTVARVRAAEGALLSRVPVGDLMRRAAFGLATRVAAVLAERTGGVSGRHVALLVGAGDNGGDALWAGAYLRRRGVVVTAVLLSPDRAHAQGLAALRRAGGRISDQLPDRVHLVLDGIVGLSGRGPLRPAAAQLVAAIRAPIIAVDSPSGVDPDTGTAEGSAVTAAETVTFGARKPVHLLAPWRCGPVHLVDIGLSAELGEPDLRVLTAAEVGALWPVPGPTSDKYSQGVVGIAAGSADYPGAAVLCAGAAVLATSGMVRFAGTAADAVRTRWPEVVATGSVSDAGQVQAWAVGPGLGTGAASRQVLAHVLGVGVPVVADADAITLLARHPELADSRDPGTPLVLTPHDREFERLTGKLPGADRVAAARDAAGRFDAVLLLKGNTTIVAAPDGRVLVNPARSSWPATAGSGDVLTGVLGALLATGLEPATAAAAATHAQELAAAIAARGGSGSIATRGGSGGAPAPASAIQAALTDAIRYLRSTFKS